MLSGIMFTKKRFSQKNCFITFMDNIINLRMKVETGVKLLNVLLRFLPFPFIQNAKGLFHREEHSCFFCSPWEESKYQM